MENTDGLNPEPKNKTMKKWLFAFLVLLLIVGAFRFGYVQGKAGYTFDPKTFKVVNQDQAPQDVNYNLLWDAIAKLKTYHIDQPTDDQQILYGAVKGALSSVGDPYTVFFTPEELAEFKSDLAGKFEGIGAEIGKRGGNLVVVAPLDGTPAKQAGLLPQDIIAKVDGESTADWTVEEAVRSIRGPKGTEVVLTIVREGRFDPFDISIKRDSIEIKSVKWEVKQVNSETGTKKVGVITLSRFGDDTSRLFQQASQDMLKQGVDALVLDLRSDPGGYLAVSVEIASYWLNKGQLVVTEAHSTGENKVYNASGNNTLGGLKTLTLINGGSASAAEILAGALKDHGYTDLLGEQSFGKGSVQEIMDLPGNSAMKVTIAKWVTPGGVNLSEHGLKPDVEVKMTEDDFKEGRDPQMDKALELVAE